MNCTNRAERAVGETILSTRRITMRAILTMDDVASNHPEGDFVVCQSSMTSRRWNHLESQHRSWPLIVRMRTTSRLRPSFALPPGRSHLCRGRRFRHTQGPAEKERDHRGDQDSRTFRYAAQDTRSAKASRRPLSRGILSTSSEQRGGHGSLPLVLTAR